MRFWGRCFKDETSPKATTCVGIGSVVAIAINIVVQNVTGERHHMARHEWWVEPRGHLRGQKGKSKAIAKALVCKLEDDIKSFTSKLRNKKVCLLSWSLKEVGLLALKFPTDLGMNTLQIMFEILSLPLPPPLPLVAYLVGKMTRNFSNPSSSHVNFYTRAINQR
jgi:hypothetical protein